jgi:hypothetical protein
LIPQIFDFQSICRDAYDLINSGAVESMVEGPMRRISVESAEALFQSSRHASMRAPEKLGAGPGVGTTSKRF